MQRLWMTPSPAQGHRQIVPIFSFFPYKKIWLQEIKTSVILTQNEQKMLTYWSKKFHQLSNEIIINKMGILK